MRWAALVLLLSPALAGEPPEGAVAPAGRWTGPNGPASHTRASDAMPVVGDVEEAWSAELPGAPAAPPVTWDGFAYVLCAASRGHWLAAVDLVRGEVVAKKMLPRAPPQPIHVWSGVVIVREDEDALGGYRRVGRTFVRRWRYTTDDGETPAAVTVHESEIYVVTGARLLRIAPGHSRPVWAATPSGRGPLTGPPAVAGDAVLVLHDGARELELEAFRRTDGHPLFQRGLGHPRGAARGPPGIVVTPSVVLVRSSQPVAMHRGDVHFVLVPCDTTGARLRLSRAGGGLDLAGSPAAYKEGLLAYHNDGEWIWWQGDRALVVAAKRWTPDLFDPVLPPTVLGDVVYFGTWAADAETGEVLWRLPLRAVRFGAVPADRLVIVVSGERLLAYRPRV